VSRSRAVAGWLAFAAGMAALLAVLHGCGGRPWQTNARAAINAAAHGLAAADGIAARRYLQLAPDAPEAEFLRMDRDYRAAARAMEAASLALYAARDTVEAHDGDVARSTRCEVHRAIDVALERVADAVALLRRVDVLLPDELASGARALAEVNRGLGAACTDGGPRG
jgi:hypothetical protein